MIKDFGLALSTQLILIITGLGLFQIFLRQKRISLFFYLPYAWGAGLLYLYAAGWVFVRLQALKGVWHYPVLGIALVLSSVALWLRRRAPETHERFWTGKPLRWYEWTVLLLVFFKITIALFVLLTNPVIDSDAANPLRWVGLSKVIMSSGILLDGFYHKDLLPPSLLSVWVHFGISRWRDNLVGLPWFFTYLSLIGISFVTCYKVQGDRLVSFVVAYLYSALPLAVVHVIRPGYADLLIAYFVLSSVAWVTLFLSRDQTQVTYLIFALMGAAGCVLTKKEGLLWAAWIIFVIFSHYLNHFKGVSWKKILEIQAVLLAIAFVLYLLSAEWVRTHFKMDDRVQWLFIQQFDVKAIGVFWRFALGMGTFNLWWWFSLIMAVFLWVKKTPREVKAFAFYLALLFFGVFYYSCFTGNVPVTLSGTNVGRFLLQISGLGLPLYVFFMRDIALVKR